MIRLNGILDKKCDPNSKLKWRWDETVTSYTEIGTYQGLCFYFCTEQRLGVKLQLPWLQNAVLKSTV